MTILSKGSFVVFQNFTKSANNGFSTFALFQNGHVHVARQDISKDQISGSIGNGRLIMPLNRKKTKVSVQHAQVIAYNWAITSGALATSGLRRAHKIGRVKSQTTSNLARFEMPKSQSVVSVMNDVIDARNLCL